MAIELVWPSLCLAVALLLLVAEAFVPSGGLIGLLAIGFLVVSIYLGFATTPYGWGFLLSAGILLPMALMLAISLWPRTPIGKRLTLNPPGPDELGPDAEQLQLEQLVGQFGRSITPLRPSGVVDFHGRRLEGSAEEGLIPTNTLVRVIKVQGQRLVVRKADIPALDDIAT